MAEDTSVFLRYEGVVAELFERTSRFPKSLRHSLTSRIEVVGLDVLECLVTASYARPAEKALRLQTADDALARLRVLLRLAFTLRALDGGGYERLARAIDEVGRMLGGWRKSLHERL